MVVFPARAACGFRRRQRPAGGQPGLYLDQVPGTDWIWTLRPRLGWASDQWLAGIASTDVKSSLQYTDNRATPQTATASTSSNKVGWTAGVGGAYAFTPQWSVKGEWLYADFGHVNASATTSDGFVTLNSQVDVKANLVRVGVDYRF